MRSNFAAGDWRKPISAAEACDGYAIGRLRRCFWSEIESQLATYSGLYKGSQFQRKARARDAAFVKRSATQWPLRGAHSRLAAGLRNPALIVGARIAGVLLEPGADVELQVLRSFQLKRVDPARPDGLVLTGSLLKSGANTALSLWKPCRRPRADFAGTYFWTLVPARTWITSWQDTKGTCQRWA